MITYDRKVLYFETDKMGIVHHSNYIRYFEEASMNFFDRIGYNFREMEDQGIQRPVVSVEARYISPLEFDDAFQIRTWVEECRAATFTFYYEICKGERLAVSGRSTHCFTRDGRPVNIRKAMPDFAAQLEKHLRGKD